MRKLVLKLNSKDELLSGGTAEIPKVLDNHIIYHALVRLM
jgi:hypothetical protein